MNIGLIRFSQVSSCRGLLFNRVKKRKSLRLFCLRHSHRGVFWLGVERQPMLFNWLDSLWCGSMGISCHMRRKGGPRLWEPGRGCVLKKDYWFKG